MKQLEKYTFGMGDRFGHQGQAQLRAVAQARQDGIAVIPVWNKSNREHEIVGSHPDSLRAAAAAAVAALGWEGAWHVDADHIRLDTVDRFLAASDFYTIDVAESVGRPAEAGELDAFVNDQRGLIGAVEIAGLPAPLAISAELVRRTAQTYLLAIREAGRIYRHVAAAKGEGNIIAEVSVDETDAPQTPAELLLILIMLAREEVPVQTIAPKFTGRFNKGVDYAGDTARFEAEFEADLCVIAHAVDAYRLPGNLKLSVHSGSDKFSLYPIINRLIRKHDAGLHVKTAGTTWLEEVIGLAEAGGDGLEVARTIYARARCRYDELIAPYAPVVDIDPARLPDPETVRTWTSQDYAGALRHDAANPAYNPHFRQFIHVAFRIAAELGTRYTDALRAHDAVIGRNVTENLYRRHILPLFG